MNDTSNVSTGKPKIAGAVYSALAGAALPTDAVSELADAFSGLGYISEDGLVNSNSPESETIKAWGGDIVATPKTGQEDTFSFTMLEALNPDVLRVVYGNDNVKGSIKEGLTVLANSKTAENRSYVFDMIMDNDVLKRIVVPDASVTDVGDITYKDDTAIGYEVTITAVPDSEGNTHYEYMQEPSAAVPASLKQAQGTTESAGV